MSDNADMLNKIIARLQNKDWIIHNFYDIEEHAIYVNLAGFSSKTQYTLILDRNIFDYIIKSLKISNELHKSAIALILYCRYLNILIEPNLALYEKFQRDKLNLEEVNTEYKKFQYIDNSEQELVNFVFGNSALNLKENMPVASLPDDFDKIDRLRKFTTFELGVLKLCTLHFDSNIKRQDKFRLFIEYSQGEFLINIPLILYSILLFDKKSIGGIMKFNKNDSETEKEQAIYNMTWDIYNINRYYEFATDEGGGKQYLFASADRLLSTILRICIKISHGQFDCIDEHIQDKNNLVIFKEWIDSRINKEDTKRDKMTREFLYSEIASLKNLLF